MIETFLKSWTRVPLIVEWDFLLFVDSPIDAGLSGGAPVITAGRRHRACGSFHTRIYGEPAIRMSGCPPIRKPADPDIRTPVKAAAFPPKLGCGWHMPKKSRGFAQNPLALPTLHPQKQWWRKCDVLPTYVVMHRRYHLGRSQPIRRGRGDREAAPADRRGAPSAPAPAGRA